MGDKHFLDLVDKSSHVSHPYSNIGIMQVSKMLEAERGFSLLWKTPVLPRLKNALLAFDSLAERLCCS